MFFVSVIEKGDVLITKTCRRKGCFSDVWSARSNLLFGKRDVFSLMVEKNGVLFGKRLVDKKDVFLVFLTKRTGGVFEKDGFLTKRMFF